MDLDQYITIVRHNIPESLQHKQHTQEILETFILHTK